MGNNQKKQRGSKVVPPHKKTKHHMIAASRLNENEKKRAGRSIIKIVERFKHNAWHYVFNTLTPYEAVLFVLLRLAPEQFYQATVVAKWENSTYKFKLGGTIDKKTQKIIESTKILYGDSFEESLRILFGGRDWCNAIAIIVEEWSPDNYFQFVNIKITTNNGSRSLFKYSQKKKKGKRSKKK